MIENNGQASKFFPKTYWHLAHPGSFLLHNVFLSKGWCSSISYINTMPNLENAVSPYSLRAMFDEKERVWENVRKNKFPYLPSRKGAIFLLDDFEFSNQLNETWFRGEERLVLEVYVKEDSILHTADSLWLDCISEHWEENALRYWKGDMRENAIPEVLVHGDVYFQDWEKPPFGMFPFVK